MKNTKNVKANENAKVNTSAEKSTEKVDLTTESKVTLVGNLRAILPEVIKADDALGAKIDKALKSKKTTVETLKELLASAIALGKPTSKPVVENEEKTAKKVITKKNTDKKDAPAPKAKTKTEEKKSTAQTEDKSPVKSVQQTGDIKAPIATMFPDTVKVTLDGSEITLRKSKPGEFLTVASIVEAMDKGSTIVFANYWTKRHIKEYDYGYTYQVKAPKSFKDDLDLCLVMVDCPTVKRVWCYSVETEAMMFFDEVELEPVEDINPYNSEKYLVRVSNGMEFEIYTADAPAE